jgi:hypothetical protein
VRVSRTRDGPSRTRGRSRIPAHPVSYRTADLTSYCALPAMRGNDREISVVAGAPALCPSPHPKFVDRDELRNEARMSRDGSHALIPVDFRLQRCSWAERDSACPQCFVSQPALVCRPPPRRPRGGRLSHPSCWTGHTKMRQLWT